MSAKEALIQEIMKQPDPVVKELHLYLSALVQRKNDASTSSKSWPKGYFEHTAGAFHDEPLERPVQLPNEKREEW